MPLAVLLIGTVTLVLIWNHSAELRQAAGQTLATISAHWTTLVVAASTAAAAGILGIVALHMMAD